MLLLLVILTSVGAMTISATAGTHDTYVDVNLNIMPKLAVEDGFFVEINDSVIVENQIFFDNESIDIGFVYNVSYSAYYGGGDEGVYGGCYQPENWFYAPNDSNGVYTETRIYGTWNVYMDDFDLGISNYDPYSGTGDTTQEFTLLLKVGWHLLTIVACELVSDATRTSFEWQWLKDSVWFYVTDHTLSANKLTKLPKRSMDPSVGNAICTATPVASTDLYNGYEWDDGLGPGVPGSQIRPIAEAADQSLNSHTNFADNDTEVLEVNYNTTYGDFLLTDVASAYNPYGQVVYASLDNFGEGDFVWWSNDNDFVYTDDATLPLLLNEHNYVFFVVSGGHGYDYWSDAFLFPVCQVSSVIYNILMEKSTGLGMGPGILISVSMFGLVAALSLKRFRK